METALCRARARSARIHDGIKRRATPADVFREPSELQFGPQYSSASLGGESALSHNKGESYAASRPIAQRIAGQPVQVAEVVRPTTDSKGFKSHRAPGPGRRRLSIEQMAKMPRWVRNRLNLPVDDDVGKCVKAIKAVHSDAVRVDILESHPVLELLNRPNPRTNLHTLIDESVTSLQFTGQCFWWLSNSKEPNREYDLWYIPSKRVREKPGNVMLRAGYEILSDNTDGASGESQSIPADKMIYFYIPDPDNPMKPFPPAQACAQAVRVDEAIATSQQQTFENGCFPALAFILGDVMDANGQPQGKVELNRTQINQLQTRLEQLYRGPAKHGKSIILDRLIDDVKFLSHKPHEMDWQQSSAFNRDKIWRNFGTPKVIAGDVENANRATALVADEAFTNNVCNPRVTMISQVMTDQLLPRFKAPEEELMMWIEECTSTDRDAKTKELELLLTNRGLLVDELRSELGLPPLPNEMGQVLVSTAMQVFEPIDGGGLEAREALLNDEAERDELTEIQSRGSGKRYLPIRHLETFRSVCKHFWPQAAKNIESFRRIERRFLVDDPQAVIRQLAAQGPVRKYGVTTLYLDHQKPTWSLGLSSLKFRLRRYDTGDTFIEQKVRAGAETSKLRTRVPTGESLGADLIPVGIVAYQRTEYEIAESRVTVDTGVTINGRALGSAVVEVKGQMPVWLELPPDSERETFSKSSALLKGRS